MPFRFICGGCGVVILEVDNIKRRKGGSTFVDIHEIVGLDRCPFCGHFFRFYPPRKIAIKEWNPE